MQAQLQATVLMPEVASIPSNGNTGYLYAGKDH